MEIFGSISPVLPNTRRIHASRQCAFQFSSGRHSAAQHLYVIAVLLPCIVMEPAFSLILAPDWGA